jgi:hypothetical protein
MRNLKVAAAVAAALASAGAGAANTDVYISGASAQKNFWYADLVNIANCVGGAGGVTGNKWAGPATAPFTKSPDFSYVQCTAGTAPLNPAITAGSTVTFHYSAELGSIWGVANALGSVVSATQYPANHIFLANAGTCAPVPYVIANASYTGGGGANCGSALGKYDLYTTNGTDSIIGGNPAYIVTHVPDIDVSDLEPAKFQFPDNWSTANNAGAGVPPLYAALNTAEGPPSAADLAKITPPAKGSFVNGEVFAIIANFVGTTVTDPHNLSSASLAAILQGDYSKWSQVPEVGTSGDTTGTPIVLVRRDHGSGSQVGASITFTQQECGAINDGGIQQENGTTVILAGSTSAMRTIVNANAGSIGYLSLTGNVPNLNETDNYVLESVDGAQPNAHNAAAGYYKFATQTWAFSPPGASVVAATLITRAETATALAAVLGNETVVKGADNRFTTAAGAEIGAYALPGIITGQNASTANVNTLVNIPTALRNYGGESCTVAAGQNGT